MNNADLVGQRGVQPVVNVVAPPYPPVDCGAGVEDLDRDVARVEQRRTAAG
jgi:hypothetical protein